MIAVVIVVVNSEALVIGAALSLSSSAFVLKILQVLLLLFLLSF